MELREKIQDLLDRIHASDTQEGQMPADALFAELNATLTPEERKEGGRIMRELLAANRNARRMKRTDINMKEKLNGIQDIISLSYIAQNYFKKDRTWLYQRINSTLINGKPAAFTDEELKIFSDALKDIGSKISETSLSIH